MTFKMNKTFNLKIIFLFTRVCKYFAALGKDIFYPTLYPTQTAIFLPFTLHKQKNCPPIFQTAFSNNKNQMKDI